MDKVFRFLSLLQRNSFFSIFLMLFKKIRVISKQCLCIIPRQNQNCFFAIFLKNLDNFCPITFYFMICQETSVVFFNVSIRAFAAKSSIPI